MPPECKLLYYNGLCWACHGGLRAINMPFRQSPMWDCRNGKMDGKQGFAGSLRLMRLAAQVVQQPLGIEDLHKRKRISAGFDDVIG